MSGNYPAGVNDGDPYFDLPNAHEDEGDEAPYRQLFEPCAMEDCTDCIGYSNGLRRDAALVICSCECHEVDHDE